MVPVDNHTAGEQNLSHNAADAQNAQRDINIAAQNAAEAGIIRIHEVRDDRGMRARAGPSGKAGREHGSGRRRAPQKGASRKGTAHFPDGRGKGDVEDEISKAAAGAGCLNGSGDFAAPINNEPGIDMRLGKEGSQVTVV